MRVPASLGLRESSAISSGFVGRRHPFAPSAELRRALLCLGAATVVHGSFILVSHAHQPVVVDRPCPIASDLVMFEAMLPRPVPPPARAEAATLARTTAPRRRSPEQAVTRDRPSAPPAAPAAQAVAIAAPAPSMLTQDAVPSFAAPASSPTGQGAGGTGTSVLAASAGTRTARDGADEAALDPGPARQRYRSAIAHRIGRPAYTNSMRRRELEGRVTIGLRVDSTGAVLSVRIRSSSGERELDENALDHVRAFLARNPRLDPPPADAAWGTRELTLPYSYVFEDDY